MAGQKCFCGYQGIDAGLGVGAGDAIGLLLVLGGPEAIIVGRDGDESAARHEQLSPQLALRGALVGAIDGIVVVEQQPAGMLGASHLIADGDGSRKSDGLAIGVGGGILEVVGRGFFFLVADGVGETGFDVLWPFGNDDGLIVVAAT